MKKILLTAVVALFMTGTAVYANNDKKKSKKKAKVENCKKQKCCSTSDCEKKTCCYKPACSKT